METWSDLPVRERFRIKFYLDTNILAYLIDNTYSGLSQTITFLKGSNFADLISSKYVIFEFVGIRKREHYLRAIVSNSYSSSETSLNMSSLLKYRDDFEAPEVSFESVQESICQKVMQELEDINNNFEIYYDRNIIHDALLQPTIEITLNSRIFREDSIMLTSAVWADSYVKEDFVLIMSNDAAFVKHFNNGNLDGIFTNHNLNKPHVEDIRSLQSNDVKLNLTLPADDVRLNTFLPTKLKETIIKKNLQFFLGKTIPCGCSAAFPTNVVCFRLPENTVLNNNLFLTIIGKDLDFIYSTKLAVNSFWNQTEIQDYPFQKEEATNISFKPMEDLDGVLTPLTSEKINRLRETGNLVFINPDGFDLI